jgi:hypothetical protein
VQHLLLLRSPVTWCVVFIVRVLHLIVKSVHLSRINAVPSAEFFLSCLYVDDLVHVNRAQNLTNSTANHTSALVQTIVMLDDCFAWLSHPFPI